VDEDLRGFLESAALVIGLFLVGLSLILFVAYGGIFPGVSCCGDTVSNPLGKVSPGTTETCVCGFGVSSLFSFAGPAILLLVGVALLLTAILLRKRRDS
jgi:hypothetical protein